MDQNKTEKKFKIQIIFAEKQKMAELVESNPASITIFYVFNAYFRLSYVTDRS